MTVAWARICAVSRSAIHFVIGFYILLLVIPLALAPVSYTTWGFPDSLFTLNTGYLMYNGKIPNIDFPYFYGGFDAALDALSFKMFGVTAKALDFSIVIFYLLAVALFYLTMFRRISPLSFFTSFVALSAIVFTRSPFEAPLQYSEQSYVMFYNRIGWALSFIVALYPFGSALDRKRNFISNIALSICAFIILLTKSPFFLFVLFSCAFLFLKDRRTDAILILIMVCIFVLITSLSINDGYKIFYRPLVELWLGAKSQESSKFNTIHKLEFISVYNLFSIASVALPAAVVSMYGKKESIINIAAVGVLIVFGIMVGSTTGGMRMEYVSIPILAAGAIIAIEHAQSFRLRNPAQMNFAIALLCLFVAGFAVPHLLNSHVGTAKGWTRVGKAIFPAGPLHNLVVESDVGTRGSEFANKADATDYISRRNALEHGIAWLNEYQWQFIVSDGIDLAMTVNDIERKKVISFYPSVFPFALRSEPVSSFPLYPGSMKSYIRNSSELPQDIDIVMVLRDDASNEIYLHFKNSLEKNFILAGQSTLWDLYSRREVVQ
jgi:hypothetical protein